MKKKFKKIIKFITQSYLSLLNSFLFLSRFSVSLKSLDNYFFKGFAYKSFLNRLSVLINYIVWSSNHFFTSSCFLNFLGSRLFRVQVFQRLGFSRSMFFRVMVFQSPGFSGSRSRVRVLVLEAALWNQWSTWNPLILVSFKGTLMQIWKFFYMFVFIWKQCPENFAFLILRILELFARKVCKFLKK